MQAEHLIELLRLPGDKISLVRLLSISLSLITAQKMNDLPPRVVSSAKEGRKRRTFISNFFIERLFSTLL